MRSKEDELCVELADIEYEITQIATERPHAVGLIFAALDGKPIKGMWGEDELFRIAELLVQAINAQNELDNLPLDEKPVHVALALLKP